MEEKLIDFNTAKLAKEKGFNVISKHWYDQTETLNPIEGIRGAMMYFNVGYAPTQSLLQKWLRKVHNIYVLADYDYLKDCFNYHIWWKTTKWNDQWWYINSKTYEEALEEGLLQGLNLIK